MEEVKNTDIMVANISPNQVPSIIQEQFMNLKEMKDNVDMAMQKAEYARNSALIANERSAGMFQKKEAIESLQEATVDLADAQVSAAAAQEVSFEYQQKLLEITKYLFGLGASNIAMNRTVVQQLEMKLRGASKEELDEFARNEIVAVVKQLKAQEDIMKKQDDLNRKVKDHELTLRTHAQKDIEHDKMFEKKAIKDKKQDDEIARQAAKDAELEERIVARVEKDKKQDDEIARQAAKDTELEKRIAARVEKDKKQDDEIARQAAKDTELEKRILARIEKDKKQDDEIARQVAMNVELSKRMDASEEKNKKQDDEIARQAKKDDELVNMINQLMQSNLEKEEQIKELKATCEQISKDILNNASMIDTKESNVLEKLNEKASSKSIYVAYIIGIIGFVMAFIQYFI